MGAITMRKSALTMPRRKSNRKIHDTNHKSCLRRFRQISLDVTSHMSISESECHIKYKLKLDWFMRIFYHPPNDPFPPFVRFHSLRLLPISPTTPSTALPLAFPALPNARDTD